MSFFEVTHNGDYWTIELEVRADTHATFGRPNRFWWSAVAKCGDSRKGPAQGSVEAVDEAAATGMALDQACSRLGLDQ